MRKHGILKRAAGAYLSVLLLAGASGNGSAVFAAETVRSVMPGSTAISTDGYTVKDDEYGSRKIWDGENGQYLYLGGKKFHLLSREEDQVLLRTAGTVGGGYNKMELTDGDLWNGLSKVEQSLVPSVDLPEEQWTSGKVTYTAPAVKNVKVYQLSLNDVFKYYGGFSDNHVGYTRSGCHIHQYGAYTETEWVVFSLYAALNLDLSSVAFTTPAGTEKAQSFQSTGSLRQNNSNRLTLLDGTGFQAELVSGEAAEKGTVTVKVTGLPQDSQNTYTQISAMAVDANGAVAAYGRIGTAQEGILFHFRIPCMQETIH